MDDTTSRAVWDGGRVDVQITTPNGQILVYAWIANPGSDVTLQVGTPDPYPALDSFRALKPTEFTISGKGVEAADPIGFDTARLITEVARLRARSGADRIRSEMERRNLRGEQRGIAEGWARIAEGCEDA